MTTSVTRLYPAPAEELPLQGLYLSHGLTQRGSPARPFVYTNFISSLDGRIALPHPKTKRKGVPPAIANPHDWRLYMELLAQSDVVLTTSRHLRAVATGRHGNLLTLATGEYGDLATWRQQQGMPPQPLCVAVSGSLELPAEQLVARYPYPIQILTGESASDREAARLEAVGITVTAAGPSCRLEGNSVVQTLGREGHSRIYSIAGPQLLRSLLASRVLDRLYLTLAHRLLGGDPFDSLLQGDCLTPAARFHMDSLYFDATALEGDGQLFVVFDRQNA